MKELVFLFLQIRNFYNLFTILFIFIIGLNNYSSAQSFVAVSGTGTASTTSSTFSTVTGTSTTIDVTDVNYVLVISTFELSMASSGSDVREASLRIADEADATNINSGIIQLSLSNPGSTDYRIGSIVYIFDVSALSGNRTYSLQHSFNTSVRTLTTKGTIVAFALKSGTEQLKNAMKRVSSPVVMSTSWDVVTGSETDLITTNSVGGFYVAASIESITTNFSITSEAEWKLQYKKGLTGTWTDMSNTAQISMSSKKDIGNISLVGILPNENTAGDYYFRIAHRRTSAESIIQTESANIVAVSLCTNAGVFPVYTTTATGVTTTSSTLTNAITIPVIPTVNSNYFIHVQYNMTASAATDSIKYGLFVDNTIIDGTEQKQYLSSGSSKASGASVGLAKNLIANNTYNLSLRHSSSLSNTLTTNNLLLYGFELTVDNSFLPIELLYIDAQCGHDTEAIVKWATATEKNNDYFTLYRSNDCINWIAIAEIKGTGNSNLVVNYEFIDYKPVYRDEPIQVVYYKLKQTDFNGKSEEFEIISTHCKRNLRKISLSPNPAKDYINFKFYNIRQIEKPLKINIYNSSGQFCFSQEFFSIKDENSFKISLPDNLKPGTYFIHSILGENYYYTGQFIKTK